MSKPLILILCTGNSCRSHLAEAIFRRAVGDLADVASAGSKPAGYVHPMALEVLKEIGLDASAHRSKHLSEFLEMPVATVITVCGNADQVCPVFPGQVNRYLGLQRSGPCDRHAGRDPRRVPPRARPGPPGLRGLRRRPEGSLRPVNAGRAIGAEFLGTALLLLAVTGSGIMGETLAAGNAAVALLGNSLATGAALYVILSSLGPVSGAHLNPVVSLMAAYDGSLPAGRLVGYLLAQFGGAVAGVWAVHLMFGQSVLQVSSKTRAGGPQLFSELLATMLLLGLIRLATARGDTRIPAYVALTVLAGYWATASTFFANPAVTAARALTDTFVGIRPADVLPFVGAQLLALGVVCLLVRLLRL